MYICWFRRFSRAFWIFLLVHPGLGVFGRGVGIVAGQKFNRRSLPFKLQLTILSPSIGLEEFFGTVREFPLFVHIASKAVG